MSGTTDIVRLADSSDIDQCTLHKTRDALKHGRSDADGTWLSPKRSV
jgi:hypothetical protein